MIVRNDSENDRDTDRENDRDRDTPNEPESGSLKGSGTTAT